MRNYGGFGKIDPKREREDEISGNDKRVKVVIEDNTIYEIDLDCYECLERKKQNQSDSGEL